MAFWGVEVKPGKPFTHKYDDLKGRLHISMATVGFGSSTAKSILQCNVGNRSPVYLCSLYPGNTESLQLNLELEEVDEVIFSVIGPRSIHMCGYYLPAGRIAKNNDDNSESYGEDIADTESEKCDYSDEDEDEYDDSFIDDDGDPEVFPPSPVSNEEEMSHEKRPKAKKSIFRRLRKYQSVESDDDGCSEEKIVVYDSMLDQSKELDNEDTLPISSLYKNKVSGRVLHQEMGDGKGAGDDKGAGDEHGGKSIIETTLKTDNVLVDRQAHREVELSDHKVDPCTVLDVGSIKTFKKKKKGKEKEKETKSSCNGHCINLDNAVQDELKVDKMTQDLLAGNEQYQEHADNKQNEIVDKMLPSFEASHAQGEKTKKKRKERSKEGIFLIPNGASPSNEDAVISDNVASPSAEKHRIKRKRKEPVKKGSHLEGDNANHEDITNEYKSPTDAAESDNVIHKVPEGKEQHQKQTDENIADDGAHDFPMGNQSEDRIIKKRKKKRKIANSEMPLSVEQSIDMVKEDGNKSADAKPSQVRTLSNGLVIEELEMGIKDGKIAASGKKISVHYTGTLKENGVVFESNVGQPPFKFRLGKGQVIEGWDVGLEGMRVGEKRRLVIPPSMTSKSEGHSTKVQPNSWLVYDFELVKVY